MKIVTGGITKPKGFLANGLSCGIKRSGKEDLSLIYSENLANAACVFTKNSVKAAPLLVCQIHLRNKKAQAIITNSGNANCFTGKAGLAHAQKTAALIAKYLKIKSSDVLVASTGIIGKPLPFEKIEHSAKALVEGLSTSGWMKAAKGILTTDTGVKQLAVSLNLGGKTVTIAGIAKGSGMIAPNMATMLGFVTTDAAISSAMLQQALKIANEQSFNRITVDGCMSTNDMLAILANGQAKNKTINTAGADFKKFTQALGVVCLDLAKKIVLDGEGATKFIEIEVKGAKTEALAKDAGLAVANSPLVKTAAFGSNPNWGRVAAAVGSLGIASITEKNLKIDFSPFDKKKIKIIVNLNNGTKKASVYTSDLSYEYVKINVEYT